MPPQRTNSNNLHLSSEGQSKRPFKAPARRSEPTQTALTSSPPSSPIRSRPTQSSSNQRSTTAANTSTNANSGSSATRAVPGDTSNIVDTTQQIPGKLLTKILYENFSSDETRLSKEAASAVGKLVEVFVAEAFARAVVGLEGEGEGEGGFGSGKGDGFLEVEDLEKLAPQLLMDF